MSQPVSRPTQVGANGVAAAGAVTCSMAFLRGTDTLTAAVEGVKIRALDLASSGAALLNRVSG